MGSWEVHVSLAGVIHYITSLGRYDERSGFDAESLPKNGLDEGVKEYLETRKCGFGELTALRHSGEVEGVGVGYERMPEKLGSSEAVWL